MKLFILIILTKKIYKEKRFKMKKKLYQYRTNTEAFKKEVEKSL